MTTSDLDNLTRLYATNEELFQSGIITKREYNRNKRLIGDRVVFVLSQTVEVTL